MVKNHEVDVKKLNIEDFESLFQEKLSPFLADRIQILNLCYTEVSSNERDSLIKKVVTTLLDPFLVFSGDHRLGQWEEGWGQNLVAFKAGEGEDPMIPKYFGKYPIVRLKQAWIKPASKDFEYNMLGLILDWLFDKYLRSVGAIYEFGCGTGHNLVRLRDVNQSAALWGLDWATSSQKLIEAYASKRGDSRLFAKRFDYFNPDSEFILEEGAAVYTVASLEQVGDRYEEFLQYLLGQKPQICIHVEPIAELLDGDSLLDYLSIEYFKKRKYLNGFLNRLQALEKEGLVKIERAQRTHVGSFFIEGYSVIVWRPL